MTVVALASQYAVDLAPGRSSRCPVRHRSRGHRSRSGYVDIQVTGSGLLLSGSAATYEGSVEIGSGDGTCQGVGFAATCAAWGEGLSRGNASRIVRYRTK